MAWWNLTGSNDTFSFLKSFRSGGSPADVMRGRIDALKGENARAGLQAQSAADAAGTVANGGIAHKMDALPPPQPFNTQAGMAVNTAQQSAPATDTSTGPVQVGIPPAAAMVEPEQMQRDAYHWNQDFLKNYLEAPLTAEERDKRTRAAHAVAGVGALGNVLSAFSNLAFAGQAAPSQTIPSAPDAFGMVGKERDRWDKVQKDYLNGLMQGRSMDMNEWRLAQQMENDRAKFKNDNEWRRYQANMQAYGQQYKEARDKIADEQWKMKFDEDVRRYGLEYGIKQQELGLRRSQLALQQAANQRENEKHRYMMENGLYGRTGGRTGITPGQVLISPNGSWALRGKKLTTTQVYNLFNSFPGELREAITSSNEYQLATANEKLKIMEEAIANRIAEDDSYAQQLQKDGILDLYTGNGNSSNNTPPSRRGDDDNTPPSQRKK